MQNSGAFYRVYVDENDEYGEEEQRHLLGEYATEEEALDAAKKVIDDFLLGNYQPGITPQELFDSYTTVGQEPWIQGSSFKAWDYAVERCKEICETGGW